MTSGVGEDGCDRKWMADRSAVKAVGSLLESGDEWVVDVSNLVFWRFKNIP